MYLKQTFPATVLLLEAIYLEDVAVSHFEIPFLRVPPPPLKFVCPFTTLAKIQ